MPLYEYKCARCGDVFEALQSFSAPPLTVHEGCGGEVERLISTPSFQFKGSGFYITDYGKKGSSAANGSRKKESAPPAKTESPASTTKSDTK